MTACTLQGMARVRSGQAPAWPLVSDRSVRSGSRVKRDFACTCADFFSPVLVVLRSQSRLMLEGRIRTLSGPSPDLSPSGISRCYLLARLDSGAIIGHGPARSGRAELLEALYVWGCGGAASWPGTPVLDLIRLNSATHRRCSMSSGG